MLTMEPPPEVWKCRAAARDTCQSAFTFRSNTSSHSLSGTSSAGRW